MLNTLGRLMWVAVGALGAMAWQSAEADKRKGAATGNGKTARPRSRARGFDQGKLTVAWISRREIHTAEGRLARQGPCFLPSVVRCRG